MVIEVKKHDHFDMSLGAAPGSECFEVKAFGIIGLESELEMFESWCLRALELGFEPVGGIDFEGECASFRCRRLAFRLKAFHVNQAFVDAVKAFKADWDNLPE